MRQLIDNRWFSLADLLLVIISGIAWISIPRYGIWFTIVALLPWGLRLLVGGTPFRRTPLDWLIAVFLISAAIGYWAAYDRAASWIKIWLIVTAVLFYYALSAQPRQNLECVSVVSFCFAVGISFHFFLTDDFTGSGERIAIWWMESRPHVDWPAMDRGYTSGLLLLAGTFSSYWLWNVRKKALGYFTIVVRFLLILGVGIVIYALVLAMSRGTYAIVAAILGTSILWKVPTPARWVSKVSTRTLFPALVLVCLAAMIVFVYLGPSIVHGGETFSDDGDSSRTELLARASYLLSDYPITGGGLGSFPGLYSQYMLAIPQFYFENSYNVFLDVASEQGIVGGLAFVLICLGSIWLVSRTIANTQSPQIRFFGSLGLFALVLAVVHGLFYDYLYNGKGTLLLFVPAGISLIGVMDSDNSKTGTVQFPSTSSFFNERNARIIGIVSLLGVAAILTLNVNRIRSIWYANLGAVEMSQVELKDFPTNQWSGTGIVPDLENAQDLLRAAVEYDPSNETANYRLGRILMLRQDFSAGCEYLQSALAQAPNHRGIIKSLGYCDVWLGNLENAQLLLSKIPEAKSELEAYVWWWGTQGRPDLSEKASMMVSRLESSSQQTMAKGPIR